MERDDSSVFDPDDFFEGMSDLKTSSDSAQFLEAIDPASFAPPPSPKSKGRGRPKKGPEEKKSPVLPRKSPEVPHKTKKEATDQEKFHEEAQRIKMIKVLTKYKSSPVFGHLFTEMKVDHRDSTAILQEKVKLVRSLISSDMNRKMVDRLFRYGMTSTENVAVHFFNLEIFRGVGKELTDDLTWVEPELEQIAIELQGGEWMQNPYIRLFGKVGMALTEHADRKMAEKRFREIQVEDKMDKNTNESSQK